MALDAEGIIVRRYCDMSYRIMIKQGNKISMQKRTRLLSIESLCCARHSSVPIHLTLRPAFDAMLHN
jgi:hypothetical protein